MVMVHIKLKRITNAATWKQIFCSQNLSPKTLGMGSIGQIEWNHELQQHGSKYFACRFPPPPLPQRRWPGQYVKSQNVVMLHIKLKGNMNAATWQQLFCKQTPSPQDPSVWDQLIKIQVFQNMVMLHVNLKGIMKAST